MNTKRWIALGITVVVVILLLVAIKFVPLWLTFVNLAMFVSGCIAGYLFKNPEVLENAVEKLENKLAKKKAD